MYQSARKALFGLRHAKIAAIREACRLVASAYINRVDIKERA